MKKFLSVFGLGLILSLGVITAESNENSDTTENLRVKFSTLSRAEKISLLKELRMKRQAHRSSTGIETKGAEAIPNSIETTNPVKRNPRSALIERIKQYRARKSKVSINENLSADKKEKKTMAGKFFAPPKTLLNESEASVVNMKSVKPPASRYNQLVKKSDYLSAASEKAETNGREKISAHLKQKAEKTENRTENMEEKINDRRSMLKKKLLARRQARATRSSESHNLSVELPKPLGEAGHMPLTKKSNFLDHRSDKLETMSERAESAGHEKLADHLENRSDDLEKKAKNINNRSAKKLNIFEGINQARDVKSLSASRMKERMALPVELMREIDKEPIKKSYQQMEKQKNRAENKSQKLGNISDKMEENGNEKGSDYFEKKSNQAGNRSERIDNRQQSRKEMKTKRSRNFTSESSAKRNQNVQRAMRISKNRSQKRR